MNDPGILLISHGNFEKDFLEKLTSGVSHVYHLPVQVEESHLDLNEFYDPTRRQYDGNKFLKEIESIFSPQYIKKIGLFRVDLFIPILTYIFGQAALNGDTGIASLYRLRNELYGMKNDEDLLLNRFQKVIIHELGHTFGLIHCYQPGCVMRSSTYVEDIDQKSFNLCISCQAKIQNLYNT